MGRPRPAEAHPFSRDAERGREGGTMTEDEWVRAEVADVIRALVPLGSRRRRLLASALIRSLGQWAADTSVAAALELNDSVADTGKPKGRLRRARDALSKAVWKGEP